MNPKLIAEVQSTRQFFVLICLVGGAIFFGLGIFDDRFRLYYALAALVFLLIIPFIYKFVDTEKTDQQNKYVVPEAAQDSTASWREYLQDRYEVGATRIHAGYISDIYKARDIHLERDVAVKVLNPNSNDPELIKARYREFVQGVRNAEKIADLRNFVSMYEADLTNESRCLVVMQYIVGCTLKERIIKTGQQGFDYTYVRRVILTLGDILIKAHEISLYHINLKPSNIIVDDETQDPYLFPLTRLRRLGFGLLDAIRHNELGLEDMVYLSPEELDGEDSSPRDQYLLGLVAYNLLLGKLPDVFGTTDRGAITQSLLRSGRGAFKRLPALETLDKVPNQFGKIITRMVDPDPRQRYPGLADAIADILRVEHKALLVARDSYIRCKERGVEEFFTEFYRAFMSYDDIASFFRRVKKSGWSKQRDALERSIDACFDFVQASHGITEIAEPNALTKIARSHGSKGRNVDPKYYSYFVEALIQTVCESNDVNDACPFDPECKENPARCEEIRHAWRMLLDPVVKYMVDHR